MIVFQFTINWFSFGVLYFFSVIFVDKVSGQTEANETGILSGMTCLNFI